jgi:peptide chain release factor
MINKWKHIKLRLQKLQIQDSEIVEKFILGAGSGGQKINKTHSCVYLKHLPSGIEIKCQEGRSRAFNRCLAYLKLCEILEKRILEARQAEKHVAEKKRRQNLSRTKAAQEKNLAAKKKHGQIKKLRKASEWE